MKKQPLTHNRVRFFDELVKVKEWQDSMCGKNEDRVLEILSQMGYKLGIDFFRQYPIGYKFVIDIAFVNEQVAIEIDGDNHNSSKQTKLDRKRDEFLRVNNWIPLRIKDKEFFGYKGSFYKSLIRLVIDERREQYNKGRLQDLDIDYFFDEDYDHIKM